MKKVGVLALQGSFAEHGEVLRKIGQKFFWVRSQEDLKGLTHIIIPGGESTTLRLLLQKFEMWDDLKSLVESESLLLFGTCAGAILAVDFGLKAEVIRNAYGSQQGSFIDDLVSDSFLDFKGVFIRAPRFDDLDSSVEVLATHGESPVLIESKNILAATFHPEMTDDTRIHEYFLNKSPVLVIPA